MPSTSNGGGTLQAHGFQHGMYCWGIVPACLIDIPLFLSASQDSLCLLSTVAIVNVI